MPMSKIFKNYYVIKRTNKEERAEKQTKGIECLLNEIIAENSQLYIMVQTSMDKRHFRFRTNIIRREQAPSYHN
jgi:hypothetical protein